MEHQAETGGTVRKRGAENRHIIFVGRLNQRIFLFGVFRQIFAHLGDKFPRGIGARIQGIRNFFDGFITVLQVVFADKRIVNPVDIKAAQ